MKIALWWILGIIFAGAASASVVINQVLYNPSETESGGEAVELYNKGDSHIDISRWKIATEASMSDAVMPENTIICPGCYYLVADKGWNSSKDNLTWANADLEELINLYNTDSGVALMKDEDIIDAVGWGSQDSITDGMFEGTPLLGVAEGNSILRINDTDNNADDFIESYPNFKSSSDIGTESYTAEASISFEIANISINPVVKIKITPSHAEFGEITTGNDYTSEIEIENTGNVVVDIGISSSGFSSNNNQIPPNTVYYSFNSTFFPMSSNTVIKNINLAPSSKAVLKLKLNANSNSTTGSYAGKISIIAVSEN